MVTEWTQVPLSILGKFFSVICSYETLQLLSLTWKAKSSKPVWLHLYAHLRPGFPLHGMHAYTALNVTITLVFWFWTGLFQSSFALRFWTPLCPTAVVVRKIFAGQKHILGSKYSQHMGLNLISLLVGRTGGETVEGISSPAIEYWRSGRWIRIWRLTVIRRYRWWSKSASGGEKEDLVFSQ